MSSVKLTQGAVMDGIVPIVFVVITLAGTFSFVAMLGLLIISYKRKFRTPKAFTISLINSFMLSLLAVIAFFLSKTAIGYIPLLVIVFGVLLSFFVLYRVAQRSDITWYK